MRARTSALLVLFGLALAAQVADAGTKPVFRWRMADTGRAVGEAAGPRFVPASPAPKVSVAEGGEVDVVVGRYDGDAAVWSCGSAPSAAWLSCKFNDGEVHLVGTAPDGESVGTAEFVVRSDGYEVRTAVPVAVTASFPAYRVSTIGNRYVEGGKKARILLGTYSGRSGGWSCDGRWNRVEPWISCSFEDGKAYLDAEVPIGNSSVYNSYGILNRGELLGRTSLFTMSYSDRGYATPVRLDAPRPADASLPDGPSLYAVSGKPYRFRIGTYTGGDEGWTCFGTWDRLASWQSCDFVDGEIFLAGTAPARTSSYNSVAVVRDGVVVGSGKQFTFATDDRDYAYGPEQTLSPRTATVSLFPTPPLYVPSGRPFRFKVGEYVGGEGGWTCYGAHNPLVDWQSCEFVDGSIYLVGLAPDGASAYNSIAVVRDGRLAGTTGTFWIYSGRQDYSHGEPTTVSPRGGVATLAAAEETTVPGGGDWETKVGTYVGGEGGWTCFGNYNQMPSWLSCRFRDGEVFLGGTPPSDQHGSTYNNVAIVRDGVRLAVGDLFWLRW